MRPLSAQEILRVWERASGLHPVDQALEILSVACPELPWESARDLPVGQRDALLLELRAASFGPVLKGYADCPACQEHLEFAVPTEPLLAQRAAEGAEELVAGGFVVRFRPLDSRDLAAVAGCADAEAGRRLLLARCLEVDGGRVEDLPEETLDQLETAMAAQDPLSEVVVDVRCPGCQGEEPLLLDIGAFFFAEVEAQAKRLVAEVATLARAYGWREADILAMSARRRQAYLAV
jgi:hypothetical protein